VDDYSHRATEIKKKQQRQVYKHLFRHYGDISFDSWLRCQEPQSFFSSVGYTPKEVSILEQDYPAIMTLNVHDQLAPKIRFLVETLQGGTGRLTWKAEEDPDGVEGNVKPQYQEHGENDECFLYDQEGDDDEGHHSMQLFESTKKVVNGIFFACQLDRVVGPYHAYLKAHGLPHGKTLLDKPKLLEEFLQACESKSHQQAFADLCQRWSRNVGGDGDQKDHEHHHYTVESVARFSLEFTPGVIPVAKGVTSPKSKDDIPLMLEHGANPLEYDKHGVTPLFWAAGTGNLNGFQALLRSISLEHEYGESVLNALDCEREPKDGATALHWACCGVRKDYIGGGGSFDICRFILEKAGDDRQKLVNMKTWTSQKTPLMLASWGTGNNNLPIVDLLVLHGARIDDLDRDGRNALHYAAAAGNEDVLRFFLSTDLGMILLNGRDHNNFIPLDYAQMYGHENVVQLIKQWEFGRTAQAPVPSI
jgi:hypothetical protein